MSDTRHGPAQGRTGAGEVPIQRHPDSGGNPERRLLGEVDRLFDQAGEIDAGRLDALLSALDEADPLPDATAFDPRQGLRRFRLRLAAREAGKGAAAARRFHSSRSKRASFHTSHSPRPLMTVRRFFRPLSAVFIVTACILLFATTVQAFPPRLLEGFARWGGGRFLFQEESIPYAERTRNPLARNEERSYDSVPDMLESFGIDAPLLPLQVPERFGEPAVRAVYKGMGIHLYAEYQSGDETIVMQAIESLQDDSWNAEKNTVDADILRVRGINHFLISDDLMEKAVWRNGAFECYIQGTVTREELRQIVSSIYEGR